MYDYLAKVILLGPSGTGKFVTGQVDTWSNIRCLARHAHVCSTWIGHVSYIGLSVMSVCTSPGK